MAGSTRRLQELVRGDDKPERRVHGVVFGPLAAVGKAIRQHSFAERAGPGGQDGAGFFEPVRGQRESVHGYERVAPPIGEPGKAGEQRAAVPAAHKVLVGCERQRGQAGSPRALGVDQLSRVGQGADVEPVARAQDHHRLIVCQVPGKNSW